MKAHLLGCLILLGFSSSSLAASSNTKKNAPASAPSQFRDCDACPEMVVIPAGRFLIGSPAQEPGRGQDEGPQTEIVFAQPFAVSRFEITRAQYQAFLRQSGHPISGGCITDRRKPGTWAADEQTNVEDPGFEQDDNHPAACVSWNDAMAYVGWLNSQTGGGYRLLAEAEWEYVARAGSTTAYPWGPSIHDGCTHMNGYDEQILGKKGNLYQGEQVPYAACSDGFVNTAPVGSFKPNAFGVYDMLGNMGEWTADCATPSYAGIRPDGASEGGDCTKKMVRGGSWGSQPRQVRSAERYRYRPTDIDDSIGIRVAKTIKPAARAK
ncbi:formylglycine-generating enzyme family protein [Sphingomonas sp. NSE70-1]|uniref:Formylglycine-generating enzyme family protein n=1 Tax=Sphingomonas caseinilyticus TaxID=2908205 RepID=A0ABT0RW86_9SPHN|nr:formylglycine-generating enzyme family protein [Sphingomonas caseinilyticus]MCL6699265.1 formylglycine-generating enzyme family protein [Sphingomonas caseinilyticus]